MGTPHLETATVVFEENGKISEEQWVRFGIREVTSELTDKGFRLLQSTTASRSSLAAQVGRRTCCYTRPERLEQQLRFPAGYAPRHGFKLKSRLGTEEFFVWPMNRESL